MRRHLLPLVLLCACTAHRPSPEERAERLRAAVSADPGSQRADDAQEDLVELEYQQATRLHTVLAYKRFLEAHPRVAQADDVRARLEALRFNSAQQRGTVAALTQFLIDHPDGAHAAQAKDLLAQAQLTELPGVTDPAQLRQLVQQQEGTATGAQASRQLDDTAFAQATRQGAAGLYDYLREFSAGFHREEAQTQLLSLKLDALIFSGQLIAAREEAARNLPLLKRLPDLEARLDRGEAEVAALGNQTLAVQSALPGNYLRPVEDLRKSLQAPDPLDRWQAAEELGQQVSIDSLDPLLESVRSARNPLIRQRAFESLVAVLSSMPPRLADYEVARRLESLASAGDTPPVLLSRAVLLDATGKVPEAAALYQKAFEPHSPDPLILRRWIGLRWEQRQPFSSAVAARQLAVWAQEIAQLNDPAGPDFSPLWSSRSLCAAVEHAQVAEEAITRAAREATEFPEDLEAFRVTAVDARRLSQARLSDAEQALRRVDANALSCGDRRVTDRVEEAVGTRAAALERLRTQVPRLAPTLLRLASERDPSPQIRAKASGLLAGHPRG